jgi:hypothetical protein
MSSGKSKSSAFPMGKRRISKDGNELAPRSLRKKGKQFVSSCSKEELQKAEVLKK